MLTVFSGIEQSQQEEFFSGVRLQCQKCSGFIEVTPYLHEMRFDNPELFTSVSAEEIFAGAEAIVDPVRYPTTTLHEAKCNDDSK